MLRRSSRPWTKVNCNIIYLIVFTTHHHSRHYVQQSAPGRDSFDSWESPGGGGGGVYPPPESEQGEEGLKPEKEGHPPMQGQVLNTKDTPLDVKQASKSKGTPDS